jgi:hypothetical protein
MYATNRQRYSLMKLFRNGRGFSKASASAKAALRAPAEAITPSFFPELSLFSTCSAGTLLTGSCTDVAIMMTVRIYSQASMEKGQEYVGPA